MVVKVQDAGLIIEHTVSIKRIFIITSFNPLAILVVNATLVVNALMQQVQQPIQKKPLDVIQIKAFPYSKKMYKPNLTTCLRILMELRSR